LPGITPSTTRKEHAFVVPIELHEHEIPDLDVAIAFGLARSGRTARDPGAMVVEDLAARTAGARVGHLPEVIALVFWASGLVADADTALFRHADLLPPEIVGLVILVIHRHPQAFRRQLVLLGQQIPGIADRIALEVVAEGEVAEHLEEGVMARRVADVLEVVVLAARAQTPLCGRRALVGPCFPAEKHVLELHHARVGEKQGRIVGRNERARGDDRVSVLLEELQEPCSDFGRFHLPILAENPAPQ
jgi:hypothetical protein